jgi:hypothetical protein
MNDFQDYAKIKTELDQAEDLIRREAQALYAMTKTPGWRVLRRYVAMSIADNQRQLLVANNWEEAKRLQEFVKAYSHLLAIVDSSVAMVKDPTVPDPAEAGQSEEEQ